ncbi:MAG: ABC transporter substrate-binding protein [Alphaproteobacteria bacterium]|nr:ABC transporter substrate-binding protein [Alphaproteobacteria bacterium]
MKRLLRALCLTAAVTVSTVPALAQTRNETLLVVIESGTNSLDIHTVGANPASYGVTWNTYDRLLTYGTKTLPDGTLSYDYNNIKPELAESWKFTADDEITFVLRKDAKFHDGTPVTAKDVKWSFDRMVSVGGFPTFQMKAGSIEKPEQFIVVDDHTFRVKLLRKDKLTVPDLGVPVPTILNSELVKKNATEKDPWGLEYTKTNSAGGGAYKVESWKPGQELVLARNDDWKSGPLPKLKKVIIREVPSAGNRRALLERGDVDVSFDLPPKDSQELAKGGKVKVAGVPIENSLWYVGMSLKQPPFDNVKVRQAVSYAVPYQKIMDAAIYGRGIPMFGGPAKPTSAAWPQPSPYNTDIAKAKALLAEAGFAKGFETTININQGAASLAEPMATLLQESLAQIGITTTINKIPGANWRAAMLKKDMPIAIDTFSGWLNYPEYYFFWGYHGQDAVFNIMSYKNPEMDKLIDAARFETDRQKYEEQIKGFVKIAWDDMPRAPLFQYYLDAAMQKNITGYTYWFHRGIDFRPMGKE